MSTRVKNENASRRQTVAAAVMLLRGLADPRCHHVADLLAAGRDTEALSYLEGVEVDEPDVYLASELMSKADFLALDVDRKQVAIDKFLDGEARCRDTNARLWKSSSPAFLGLDVGTALLLAQREICSILGEFSWNEASQGMGFGPGAAVGLTRRHSCPANKIGAKPTASSGGIVLGETVLRWFEQWGKLHDFRVHPVVGNKIVTVPKNAKTDRIIAIEPLVNLFIQKGIGRMIRTRLRYVGIDLDDQQRNRDLASEASKHGLLATIDLSAASDTIASGLVEKLLPSDWYDALALCRSERGVLPSGSVIHYQKFSSMGNGFTFELESLIFLATLRVVQNRMRELGLLSHDGIRTLSVYGDDLICPVEMVEPLESALACFGFQMNRKKSHATGMFRESCGIHMLQGRDITPIYIRRPLSTVSDVLLLANNIARLASRMGSYGAWRRADLKPAYDFVVSLLPSHLRKPLIPDGMGDGALIGDFVEVLPRRAGQTGKYRTLDGWVTKQRLRVPKRAPVDPAYALVADLVLAASSHNVEGVSAAGVNRGVVYGLRPGHVAFDPSVNERSGSTNDGPVRGYRWVTRELFVPKQWQDLGPWL